MSWYKTEKAFEYYYDDEANEFVVYVLIDNENGNPPVWYFWGIADDYEEVKAIAGEKPLMETVPTVA